MVDLIEASCLVRNCRLTYGLTLHRFVIEFLKSQQSSEEGFTFFGFGLSLTLSPERLITYIIKGNSSCLVHLF